MVQLAEDTAAALRGWRSGSQSPRELSLLHSQALRLLRRAANKMLQVGPEGGRPWVHGLERRPQHCSTAVQRTYVARAAWPCSDTSPRASAAAA